MLSYSNDLGASMVMIMFQSEQTIWMDLDQITSPYLFQDILKPGSVYQYKSQEERSQPPMSMKSLGACIKYTLVFQIVTSLIGNILVWRFRYQWINIVNPLLDFPSFTRYVLWQLWKNICFETGKPRKQLKISSSSVLLLKSQMSYGYETAQSWKQIKISLLI